MPSGATATVLGRVCVRFERGTRVVGKPVVVKVYEMVVCGEKILSSLLPLLV